MPCVLVSTSTAVGVALAGQDPQREAEALRERAGFYDMEAKYGTGEKAQEAARQAERLRDLARSILEPDAAS